mgnify:CR=1 FL=1
MADYKIKEKRDNTATTYKLKTKGLSLKTNRAIAYTVLVGVTVLCLFWFYVLFINATRSHSELTRGFTALPSGNFVKNWKGLMEGTLPVWSGVLNSLLVSGLSAVLCTYFSAMTAYARDHKEELHRIANSIAYADRMPPDFSTVLMKDYLFIEKDYRAKLMQIPAFARWLTTKGRLMNGLV